MLPKSKKLSMVLFGLLSVACLTGFARQPSEPAMPETDVLKSEAGESLSLIIKAYEREDLNALREALSRDFQAMPRAEFLSRLSNTFNETAQSEIHYRVQTALESDRGIVSLRIHWQKRRIDRQQAKPSTEEGDSEFVFRWEDGSMRLYNFQNNGVFL